MKKIIFAIALLMSAQSFAGGSDVGSSNGGKFPFGGARPAASGYMVMTAPKECKIVQGKGLYAGEKNPQQAPQDLVKAVLMGDSRSGKGLIMTLQAPGSNQALTVGLIGELTTAQGDEFNFLYQAPDQFHHYNRVDYKMVQDSANNSVTIDITMFTAEGTKGTAQVKCSAQ